LSLIASTPAERFNSNSLRGSAKREIVLRYLCQPHRRGSKRKDQYFNKRTLTRRSPGDNGPHGLMSVACFEA